MIPPLDTPLTLFTAVNLLGAVQGLALALALVLYREGDRTAHRLLAALVACGALAVGEAFLCESNLILRTPHLVDAAEPLVLALGPLFYLYLRALVRPGSVTRRAAWHLAPAALYALYLVPFYLSPVPVKVMAFLSAYHPALAARYESPGEPALFDVLPLRALFDLLAIASMLAYALAAGVLVARAWRAQGSGRQRTNGAALVVLLGAFVLPFLAFAVAHAMGLGDAKEPSVAAVAALGLYAVGYVALLRPGFLRDGVLVDAPPGKYARSALTGDQDEAMRRAVVETLEDGERFRDPDLKLAGFAKAAGLSRHHVSQVANIHFGGFAALVNGRRVEAAQALLRTDAGRALTLEEVGYRSGFNSRTAFYNAFKKHAGCSPSQYRDSGDGASHPDGSA